MVQTPNTYASDISEQPILINLQGGVPMQIPTSGHGNGVQLINHARLESGDCCPNHTPCLLGYRRLELR